jgi:signal transduction histidine kinase
MSKIDFRETEPGLDLSDGQFRQLVEQSGDVTMLVSSLGHFRYISPSLRWVLGDGPNVSSLITFLAWIHLEDRPHFLDLIKSHLDEARYLHCRLRHHDGHWVPCHLLFQNFSGIENRDSCELDNVRWFLLNFRPMTILMESQLPKMEFQFPKRAIAFGDEPAEQLKFLGIISHELRTPINAMNGFAQLLLQPRRSPLTPDQQGMVQRILANGQTLLSLINNILDLSKLDTGLMQLQLETFSINDLIQSTVQNLSSLATEKNLTIHTDIRLLDPLIVNDSMRLRQIVVNLLSNAIKVSQAGDVWLTVEPVDSVSLQILVQDTGPGIAADDIQWLFNEFWQKQLASTQFPQGTGLGLTICHHLVEMMQGEILVQSQLGEGATFRVVIPRRLVR